MRFRRIARNYVTHWFMADLSMILLDVARLHWNPELADAAAMLEGSRQLLTGVGSSQFVMSKGFQIITQTQIQNISGCWPRFL